jgi:very-short-patch-repair endonuclease
VTSPLGIRAPRRPGVRGHCADLDGLVQVMASGLRVVSVAACWSQLSSRLGLADLVAVADAAVRAGLVDRSALEALLADPRHRRGRRARRRAMALIDPRAESAMESILRVLMLDDGLPLPEVNRDVVVDGLWLARPDLSYPQLKIAIEYDGDHHRTDQRQWRSDKTRRRLLEDAGWIVIEVIADDVYRRPDLLLARIAAAVRRRTRQLT